MTTRIKKHKENHKEDHQISLNFKFYIIWLYKKIKIEKHLARWKHGKYTKKVEVSKTIEKLSSF
jgi:hypothetical protein